MRPRSHGKRPEKASGAVEADVLEVQDWVERVLPAGGRELRLLEVGCGPGHLAARLSRRGVDITAIDVDEEQVALARQAGAPAVLSDFLSYADGPFEAVLFTRSLHHIHPLEAAMQKLRALLRPGGWILADEFAHDEIDASTAAWFWDLQAVLEESGVLAPDVRRRHGHGGGHRHPEGPPPADPLERWRERHRHDPPLHGARALASALRSAFKLKVEERGPYLHRYLADRLEPTAAGTRLFLRVRATETLRVRQGLLVPVGMRLVARV